MELEFLLCSDVFSVFYLWCTDELGFRRRLYDSDDEVWPFPVFSLAIGSWNKNIYTSTRTVPGRNFLSKDRDNYYLLAMV